MKSIQVFRFCLFAAMTILSACATTPDGRERGTGDEVALASAASGHGTVQRCPSANEVKNGNYPGWELFGGSTAADLNKVSGFSSATIDSDRVPGTTKVKVECTYTIARPDGARSYLHLRSYRKVRTDLLPDTPTPLDDDWYIATNGSQMEWNCKLGVNGCGWFED